MLSKLRAFASLYRELGPRWTLFRLAYALRLRTGIIRLQMPMGRWSDYKNLVNVGAGSPRPTLPLPNEYPPNVSWKPDPAVNLAAYFIGKGMPLYFSHRLVHSSFPPDWHTDYFSENIASPPLKVSANKHWSQISDDANGDIKFIWELNRFGFVYEFVRAYAASQNEEYPEAFWTLIEDWAKHNHPNTGPNWMDGQEVALRLMAWTFGYHAFLNSPSTTSERKDNFTLYVAAQAERIYKNIGYAISTRSNHTISEAFGLWMVGLLFPELKHGEKYLAIGKKLLEQEAANQIFPDGSYSMYSLNYHRFILHIYLYAIRLGEINNSPFPTQLINSVTKSIEYLACLINPKTGEMPVYGSNDGALVLPINSIVYFTDYRPLLQLGWYITKGEFLFEPGPWDEDVFWLCGTSPLSQRERVSEGRVREKSLTAKSAKPAKEKLNLSALSELRGESFPNGGVYLLRNANSHVFIRCTDFTSRPSHADQLHVDLWMHGYNIAIDAGTYLYSGQGHWRNGLAHTSVHNTVTVDNKDQMTMLSRFTWTNWLKGKVLKHDFNTWLGEHDGYKPVSHKRTVMSLEGDRWLVVDNLSANKLHNYKLHWLLADGEYGLRKLASENGLWLQPFGSKLPDSKINIQLGLLNGDGNFSIVRADPNSTRGWRSRYYGHKEPAISVMLEADQPQVTFWTFFGFEDDVVEIAGNSLKINSETIEL
ncbi:MAG: alginate lyase family protein [Anaerolineales bacterium]|nr:alginate lyase family protein [Anaerolineales bacterium]